LFNWLLLRAAAQAAMVLVLARFLGAEGYGTFVALLAIMTFYVPLASLGLGGVLLRDGAREPEALAGRLGMAIALWWPATLAFSMIAVLTTRWVLPYTIPLTALVFFALAEIAATSFVELAARVEQSQHRLHDFGGLLAGLAVVRLTGLLAYLAISDPDAVGWIWTYASASMLYMAAVAMRLTSRYRPVRPLRLDWKLAIKGFPFTVGALSFRLQAELNKPLLAQASYGDVGIFSVAQRMVDMASLPLQAMQEALWPRFYTGSPMRWRMSILATALIVVALLQGLVLVMTARWLSVLLGSDYAGLAEILVWLSLLPAFQVLRSLLSAAVFARREHSYLTSVFVANVLACIVFNSILVSQFGFGLHEAAMVLYCCEIVMLLMLVYKLVGRKRTSRSIMDKSA
jgi:O-antigen/teichoic acid export membrane protein